MKYFFAVILAASLIGCLFVKKEKLVQCMSAVGPIQSSSADHVITHEANSPTITVTDIKTGITITLGISQCVLIEGRDLSNE